MTGFPLSMFWMEFRTGNTGLIVQLIENGADVKEADWNGYTPLHFYLYFNKENPSLDFVKYLIKKGADINAKTKDGNTPLDYVSESMAEKIREINSTSQNAREGIS
jgi:ankyrin repeat protein